MGATKKAHDLAAYIVGQLGRVETLKLQKLLYYCNGWHLALRNRPIFNDPIQAWRHGPVVQSIYSYHRTEPSVSTWTFGNARELTADERAVAQAVLKLYGAKSGWALRNLTHEESPWVDAWARSNDGAIRGVEISQDTIRDFFSEKIN